MPKPCSQWVEDTVSVMQGTIQQKFVNFLNSFNWEPPNLMLPTSVDTDAELAAFLCEHRLPGAPWPPS